MDIEIYNKKGEVVAIALVDGSDFMWLSQWNWYLIGGYAYRTEQGYPRAMHRDILGLPLKAGPSRGDREEGDHMDGNSLNNQRMNLRVVTHAQNLQNKGISRGSSSRYRGVYWEDKRQKWRAEVKLNGQKHCLGAYDFESDAAQVVEEWREQNVLFAIAGR